MWWRVRYKTLPYQFDHSILSLFFSEKNNNSSKPGGTAIQTQRTLDKRIKHFRWNVIYQRVEMNVYKTNILISVESPVSLFFSFVSQIRDRILEDKFTKFQKPSVDDSLVKCVDRYLRPNTTKTVSKYVSYSYLSRLCWSTYVRVNSNSNTVMWSVSDIHNHMRMTLLWWILIDSWKRCAKI